jgi:hypothetical protein
LSHEEFITNTHLAEVPQNSDEGRFIHKKTFTQPRNDLAYNLKSGKSQSVPQNFDTERLDEDRFNKDLSPQEYKSEYARQYRQMNQTQVYSTHGHLENSHVYPTNEEFDHLKEARATFLKQDVQDALLPAICNF